MMHMGTWWGAWRFCMVFGIITGILDGLLGEPLPDSLRWDATTYILTGTGRRELGADERAELGALVAKFPLLQ